MKKDRFDFESVFFLDGCRKMGVARNLVKIARKI